MGPSRRRSRGNLPPKAVMHNSSAPGNLTPGPSARFPNTRRTAGTRRPGACSTAAGGCWSTAQSATRRLGAGINSNRGDTPPAIPRIPPYPLFPYCAQRGEIYMTNRLCPCSEVVLSKSPAVDNQSDARHVETFDIIWNHRIDRTASRVLRSDLLDCLCFWNERHHEDQHHDRW